MSSDLLFILKKKFTYHIAKVDVEYYSVCCVYDAYYVSTLKYIN